jgi:CO/xanthine dehydrogenase FAD-binding subunit
MKPVDFDYVRPASLGEVCAALREAGEDGKIIAGGQTLVPLLAMRLARPRLVIDINAIAELQGIESHDDAIVLRACTRQAAALADDKVRRRVPLLAKALRFVGHVQTRHRGTIGGSLANADPAAEIGLAATALGATVTARSTSGERPIAMTQFFRGAMETALAAEECLSAVSFPAWRDGRIGTGFQEVSARRSDFALAAAAVQLALDEGGICRRATLAIGGAGAMPLAIDVAAQRLVGTRLADADLADAAGMAEATIAASGDANGSALYRRRVAGEMARRALAEARDELAGHA